MRRWNSYSHAGRARSCMKDGRYPTALHKAEGDLRQNYQHTSSEGKKKPEVQVQMLKLDTTSGTLWEMAFVGIMLLQELNAMVQRTILWHLWILSMSRDIRKQALMCFKRRPLMILGISIKANRCLNLGSVWHGSRCSTKIHQRDICKYVYIYIYIFRD